MKLQLIRNATMKISYAGRTLLTDPMLSAVGAFRSFAGIAPNPTIGLPLSVQEILSGVEAVIVSHLHPDHFDEAAVGVLPKNTALFCQPGDSDALQAHGFNMVTTIANSQTWEGITLTRTGGNHGSGKILERLGKVSGFVLRGKGEPTLYWVGDSIWCNEVSEALTLHKPDVIITHSGGATLPGHPPIIMDSAQTLALLQAAPGATAIAVHMEALDHCTVSRSLLRREGTIAGVPPARLLIPEDGEILSL